MVKINKNLLWAITVFSIVIVLCGTMIWINYNSWTFRFEMDDNTKEALMGMNISEITNVPICEKLNNYTYACPVGYVEIPLSLEVWNE